jgi:cystathionine beta-lyase
MSTALNPELTEISIDRLRLRRSAKWARYPADVLPAWVAEMDFPLAEPVRLALAEAVQADDCGYAAPEELGLAEAFAGFAEDRLGWWVDPEAVSPSSDVVGAITAVLRAIAKPGERVVINTPVYHPFFAVVDELGCELAEAPLADGELDPEAIEQRFAEGAVALILCSPHNPTGGVPSREQLAAIADAAARHGAWVLADEIHAPLTLPGAEHVPFLTVSEEAAARGIALVSASKTFNLAGLGCAQIVTAADPARAAVAALPPGARHCGHLGAIASAAAYEHGAPWLDAVLAVLDHNRDLVPALLAELVPAARCEPPAAGYLVWIDLGDLGLGADPAAAILERGRVAFSSGPAFGRGGEGHVRLNAGTSPELVREAIERLAGAINV